MPKRTGDFLKPFSGHEPPSPEATLASEEYCMGFALQEAEQAATHGDVPIGAVVVREDGLILARGRNRREQDFDPTAHAEIVALRAATAGRGHWRLDDCTLFVTLEPCAMCAGALVNSRIRRVVYGAKDAKGGALDSLFELGRDPRLNHRFHTTSGVCEHDARTKLQVFFRRLRNQGQK